MQNANEKERFGYQQAAAQMSSISEMVAALNCDYDRLADLREEVTTSEEAVELHELEEDAGDCESHDEALERIHNDPLSVEVRSGWHEPGGDNTPSEFRIVLCTGGPHVELLGDLDEYGQPDRVYMRYADWGESGEYHGENFDHDALLAYAQCFYFGE